jgi:hypothetical protein
MSKPIDPYIAFRELAEKMQNEGVDAVAIIDALIVGGLNLAIRASSKEAVASNLEKIASELRLGNPIATTRH